jgi:hypothetical protein
MRKLKYVKLFENFNSSESLLYKPDGGSEKYLFVYGNKKDNKMVAHTAWEYRKKPVTENMLSTLKNNWPGNYNGDILRKIMDADEVEYLEDQHSILPMFRFIDNGKTLFSGDDGKTMIDGWISNKVFGSMNLQDYDFQDMKRERSGEYGSFICEAELDEFIENSKIGDSNGFKKALRAAGFAILSSSNCEGVEFVHDPKG